MAGALFSTDNYGVTKLPNASTFSKGNGPTPGDLASGSEARGASGLPGGGSFKDSVSSPPGIDPAHMDELKKAAASGDPEAGHLLQVLASMGAGGAGMLLARSLMGRGKGTVTGPEVLGAGNSAGRDLVPSDPKVTQLKDEQIIPRSGPQKKLPGQRYLTGPEANDVAIPSGMQARAGTSNVPPTQVAGADQKKLRYFPPRTPDENVQDFPKGVIKDASEAAKMSRLAAALRRVVR